MTRRQARKAAGSRKTRKQQRKSRKYPHPKIEVQKYLDANP